MADINEGVIFFDHALQNRRGTSADLALCEYVPAPGELVIATDTGEIRYGDGVNVWANLKTCDNTKITNNLETSDTGEALDAAQGKVLNDRLRMLEGLRGIDCGEITLFIRIDQDDTEPVTDFYYYKYASLTFTATYVAPPELEGSYPVWNVEGLPEGLTAASSNGVLTISGYAQEQGMKDVAITASFGTCSDTKVYSFEVQGGPSIEISNSGLGDWNIGSSKSVTLTSSVIGDISGTTTYYAEDRPSWMSLNSSTGVLSGSPSGSAGTYSVSAYVTKGDYRSPAKSLSYRVINLTPRWARSSITLDITALSRNSKSISSESVSLMNFIASSDKSLNFSIDDESVHLSSGTSFLAISLSCSYNLTQTRPFCSLIIGRKGKNTQSKSYSGSTTIVMSNAYGSSSMHIFLKIADKATYTNNSSGKYASTAPIVT
ncbi:MAG: putative Ig domain-containing protein [Synergistaceae bacterium]|nr:putative Ig domain-containing protein [Synergistaceae bacterium]